MQVPSNRSGTTDRQGIFLMTFPTSAGVVRIFSLTDQRARSFCDKWKNTVENNNTKNPMTETKFYIME